MKPTPLMIRFLLSFFICAIAPLSAAAGDEATMTAAQIEVKRARVLELKAQAKSLRQKADATHQQASVECRQTVLVNNCLSRAGNLRLEKVEQARGLESQVNMLEREIRHFEVAERRAERARRLAERKLPTTVNVEGATATTMPPGEAAGSTAAPEAPTKMPVAPAADTRSN